MRWTSGCAGSSPARSTATASSRCAKGKAVLTFGKHRDRPLAEIVAEDAGYLRWVLESDFPDDAKAIVREAMDSRRSRGSVHVAERTQLLDALLVERCRRRVLGRTNQDRCRRHASSPSDPRSVGPSVRSGCRSRPGPSRGRRVHGGLSRSERALSSIRGSCRSRAGRLCDEGRYRDWR